jgi:hypothetical protein
MPTDDDEEKTAIEESRQVVHRFLYGKPHLEKEGLRVAGCAVAFVLAGVGYWYGKEWATVASYLCLMFTLLVNEIITWKWRSERDRSLLAIKRRW